MSTPTGRRLSREEVSIALDSFSDFKYKIGLLTYIQHYKPYCKVAVLKKVFGKHTAHDCSMSDEKRQGTLKF